jgi:transposase
MAFVTKRKKGNKIYYYLARSFRKNGRPTHEIILCLGTADEIQTVYSGTKEESVSSENVPTTCRIFQFGAVSALLNIAERLNIVGIIDEFVPKRTQGLSVGSYMVLAAINRAVQPVSKNTFYEWFSETVLASSFPEADKNTLSCQSFWNHMVELDQESITAIEDKITQTILKNYDISTNCLLFDNTNFITYIDTANPAKIPQRGHSKEKRSALKIIGLSLMVSPDYNIPLFHETYPGNRHDSKQIINIIDKLRHRLLILNKNVDNITLVFDKGNNSKEFIELLENETSFKFHFVGGLRLNQCPELITFDINEYIPLAEEKLCDTSAVRFRKEIYGRQLTIIITNNPKLKKDQLDGLEASILKCETELKTLQDSLKKRVEGKIIKGRRPTSVSITKKIQNILSAEHMKKIFIYDISTTGDQITLNYQLDKDKYNYVVNTFLGKSILFTNRDNWSNEQIVSTYRSQFHVEENFKQLKNIKFLSFRPVRHFTDRTIKVHAFYCILALILSSLLKLEIEQLGHPMTINMMLKELSKARQSIHIYSDNVNKIAKVTSAISEVSEAAEKYIAEYDLKKYLLNVAQV